MNTAGHDAAHFNARIRGMKSRLFSREQFDNLLDLDDIALLMDVLLNSPYGPDLAEALAASQGVDAVEDAVSRNLARTFSTITGLTPPHFQDIAGRFLLRWDLAAVKTLIRLERRGHTEDESPAAFLTPGPTLFGPALTELAKCSSMQELIRGLAWWRPDLATVLQRALPHYLESGDTVFLEETLDRHYYTGAVAELRDEPGLDAQLLQTILKMEIDRINVRSLVQLRYSGHEPQDRLERTLRGGSISQALLERMAAAPDAEHIMELLALTPYKELIEGLYGFLQTGRFSGIQRLFDQLLITRLRKMACRYVLSIAVLMSYAWLKYNEALNLRLIARGVVRHLPRGRVREGVIYA